MAQRALANASGRCNARLDSVWVHTNRRKRGGHIVRMRDRDVVEEWSSLVNPGCRVPRGIEEFTGISSPYEAPENPELKVDTGSQTLEQSVEQVLAYLSTQGVIPQQG